MSSATSLPFGVNDTAVRTTLASGITSTDTSIGVGEVTNSPALPFLIAVFVDQSPLREDDMEIMEVTSISGTTLTVNRGQKGTSAQSFSSGDKVFVGVLPSDFVDDPAFPAAEKTANPTISSVDYSVYTSGPSHGEGGFAFRRAARASDGRVIFAPFDSANVGIFNPSTDSYTSGPSHGEGGFAFQGAAQPDGGRVIFAPRDSNNVGISGAFTFTKDTVPVDLSSKSIIHVTRGGDGPIEINAQTFDDGRRAVAYVSVENAGGFGFSVVTDGGSGTFKWSGGTAPTLGSGSGVVSVIGLKQTGPNEVTGFAVEQ